MEDSNIAVMNRVLKKAPVVGFVRYSQKILFGESEIERDMFESNYFEYRFKIFLNVTLKSFQGQTNKNFVLLILHSENMPIQFKARFIELENANSFLQNIFVKDTADSFNDALHKSVENVLFKEDIAITFRIDNDDAVQSTFIQTLTNFQKSEFLGYSICIPSVLVVKHVNKDHFIMQELNYPENSLGLAYVTHKNEYKTVLELGDHQLTNDQIPLILLPRNTNKALLTINGENASNQIHTKFSKLFSKEQLEEYLSDRDIKEVDLSCLKILKDDNKVRTVTRKTFFSLLAPPLFILIQNKLKLLFAKNNK